MNLPNEKERKGRAVRRPQGRKARERDPVFQNEFTVIGSRPLYSLLLALRSLLPLCSLLLTLHSHAQTLPPKITTFTPEQYEAHGQILSTEALLGGRRAFGTADEVIVHLGETFVHVPVGKGKYAFSMDRDSAGRLFVGGSSLMGVITPDSTGTLAFRSLQPLLPDSLKDFGNIWNTVCDEEGGVYFNPQGQQLFYYKGDTMRVIRPETKFFTMDVPSGRLVVQDVDTGLFTLSGTQKEYLPGTNTLSKGKTIRSILPTPGDEDTWTIFTTTQGLYSYDPATGKTDRFEGEDGRDSHRALREGQIYTATRLDPGTNPYGAAYAVGTRLKGLYLLGTEGSVLLHLGSEAGLPTKDLWQVTADENGNIWAATNNGIALVHTGLPFTVAGEGGLFSGGIQDISRGIISDREASPCPLFLATQQGAWKWTREEGNFAIVPGSEGQCMALHPHNTPDGQSRMLIAAANAGLLSTPALPGRTSPGDTLSGDHTYTLTDIPTPLGRGVLFGGRDGLHVLVPTKEGPPSWKELLSVEGIPKEVQSVGWAEKEDAPDSLVLWAGTASKGVLRVITDTNFTKRHLTQYDTGNGLPEGPIDVFRDPSTEGDGVLFGMHQGLYIFEDGKFVPSCRYGRIFCDSSRQVSDLEKGSDGEVWIDDATGGGIKHLIREGEGHRIDSTVFRALELGAVRAIFPEQGRTWVGGDRGLACYFPKMGMDLDRVWDCRVSEVRGSGDGLLFGGWHVRRGEGRSAKEEGKREMENGKWELFEALERVPVEEQPDEMVPVLPYSEGRVAFEFAAAYPDRQEAVEYSYKLAGFDTTWSKWTERTKKEYTNLDEGTYTFRVKARNIYLKESTVDEYRFTILPPWYRTWAAYSGYAAASVGFIWLLLWLNSRRLVAQKRRLEKIVDDRTREIQEEKKKVEQKNQDLETANEIISQQKEEVEVAHGELQETHKELHEAHQEITSSIAYARRIQDALLQSEKHVSPHVPEHFILFKPQSQVSGDFYWAKEHKGHLYFAAVDCTGHGVPGAFMSMLGISQLNEIMNTNELLTTGTILTRLRERVVRELTGADPENAAKDGMDAGMVRVPLGEAVGSGSEQATGSGQQATEGGEKGNGRDGGTGTDSTVQFAGANNSLYVVRKGIGETAIPGDEKDSGGDRRGRKSSAPTGPTIPSNDHPLHVKMYRNSQAIPIEEGRLKPFKKTEDGLEVKGDKMAVGYEPNAEEAFVTTEIELKEGDALYFFSDGYADQFGGPKGKKFRYGPFKQLLVDLHQKPMDEQKKELDRIFEDWKAGSDQEQIDDVVVIGVRVPSSSNGRNTQNQ